MPAAKHGTTSSQTPRVSCPSPPETGLTCHEFSRLVSGGENTVLLDMRREAQCVLAVKAFGELCVARLERIDDLLVIFDRALGTMFLSQRHVADRPHMDEEISRHLGDQRAFAQLDDGL